MIDSPDPFWLQVWHARAGDEVWSRKDSDNLNLLSLTSDICPRCAAAGPGAEPAPQPGSGREGRVKTVLLKARPATDKSPTEALPLFAPSAQLLLGSGLGSMRRRRMQGQFHAIPSMCPPCCSSVPAPILASAQRPRSRLQDHSQRYSIVALGFGWTLWSLCYFSCRFHETIEPHVLI